MRGTTWAYPCPNPELPRGIWSQPTEAPTNGRGTPWLVSFCSDSPRPVTQSLFTHNAAGNLRVSSSVEPSLCLEQNRKEMGAGLAPALLSLSIPGVGPDALPTICMAGWQELTFLQWPRARGSLGNR